MNVNDIASNAPAPTDLTDRLAWVFNRQAELKEAYDQIELNNGFHVPGSVEIDDRHVQHHIKNMAWRCLEEVAEALDAMQRDDPDQVHCHEELADACHFLVELFICAGLGPQGLHNLVLQAMPLSDMGCRLHTHFSARPLSIAMESALPEFIRSLGMAMNCLKNKPWKQTHMLTDRPAFQRELTWAWLSFVAICSAAGLDHESLYRYYFKKSEVNKFRQRSNY